MFPTFGRLTGANVGWWSTTRRVSMRVKVLHPSASWSCSTGGNSPSRSLRDITAAFQTEEGGDGWTIPFPPPPTSCSRISCGVGGRAAEAGALLPVWGLSHASTKVSLGVRVAKRSTTETPLAEHDLTFDHALAIAQSMEPADRNIHTLRGGDLTQQGAICQILQRHAKECYHCGSPTYMGNERHFHDATCHNCQKKGHIAKVCRSRVPASSRQTATGNQGGGRQTT